MLGKLIGAMVTPFNDQNEIDYNEVEKILKHYEDLSHDAVVILGTTGEESSLSEEEKENLINFCFAHTCLKIIVGICENNTLKAIQKIRNLNKWKVSAFLVNVPYYNKPPQNGIFLHFKKIAQASEHPILIYNVPARTGTNIEYQTIRKLIRICPNIIGIKECSNDFNLMSIIHKNHPNFLIYHGNDANFYLALNAGACGIISVASIIYGKDYAQLIHDYEEGFKNCLLVEYLDLIGHLITYETNPIPIKYILSKKGYQSMNLRLPLIKLSNEGIKALEILY